MQSYWCTGYRSDATLCKSPYPTEHMPRQRDCQCQSARHSTHIIIQRLPAHQQGHDDQEEVWRPGAYGVSSDAVDFILSSVSHWHCRDIGIWDSDQTPLVSFIYELFVTPRKTGDSEGRRSSCRS
ncbi:uncharacterized protein B0H18DRAFT_354929 [Fomitopsis serialis]|uniref:uncharacterized protein n=1 Tax=Fomitopsis serialis TaxID=139415 RepID=UPI0020086B3E|nr:uncharacterized protein B0H18DRAFT_354929 [Neoantrodia serialis]KAH9911553.1 hypothetical protein B0H18DRAFT_354929 [Neoantrodia serialis]